MRVMRVAAALAVLAWLATGAVAAQGASQSRRLRRKRRRSPRAPARWSWSKPKRARSSSRPIPTRRRRRSSTSSDWSQKRFYNGQRVHRVVPNFVVQMGDPQTRDMTKQEVWGTAAAARPSASRSSQSCARIRVVPSPWRTRGDARNADSQFYVDARTSQHSSTASTSIFGKVISGMDVVDKIR